MTNKEKTLNVLIYYVHFASVILCSLMANIINVALNLSQHMYTIYLIQWFLNQSIQALKLTVSQHILVELSGKKSPLCPDDS